MNTRTIGLAFAVAATLTACAADDPHRRAKTGAAVGAVTGAVIGDQVHGTGGAGWGAVVGAVSGGTVGHYMDRQQQEMERELAEQERDHELEIQRVREDLLKIDVQGDVMFDFDSAALKPAFRPALDKMAGVIGKYERTVVHVVGHTDSVGSERYNESLSRDRAANVADYLIDGGGVDAQRVRVAGRGESQPRATNATEAGRQLNRRVEVYIRPIVEGRESDAYESPS